jgi:uncharacterized membrane protein YfcA
MPDKANEIQELKALEATVEKGAEVLPRPQKGVLVALGALAGTGITLVTVFGWVDWSAAQTALVTTEASAAIGLITALVAHLNQKTPREPVAVAATFTACISTTLALGTAFVWWTLTQEQISALVALVTTVLGVSSAWFARGRVFAKPKK